MVWDADVTEPEITGMRQRRDGGVRRANKRGQKMFASFLTA